MCVCLFVVFVCADSEEEEKETSKSKKEKERGEKSVSRRRSASNSLRKRVHSNDKPNLHKQPVTLEAVEVEMQHAPHIAVQGGFGSNVKVHTFGESAADTGRFKIEASSNNDDASGPVSPASPATVETANLQGHNSDGLVRTSSDHLTTNTH